MPIRKEEYHPKWSLISRLVRIHRAKNKCEWCGVANKAPHPITGAMVILTVAHIDRDRRNNRFWNLAGLCQRCHLNHDRSEHISNRRYGRNWKNHQLSLFPSQKRIGKHQSDPTIPVCQVCEKQTVMEPIAICSSCEEKLILKPAIQ